MPRRPADIHPRLILGLYGPPKSGKSHFTLTAPQPIKFINTDFGIDELIVRPEFAQLNIEIEDVAPKPDDHDDAKRCLALFHETFLRWLDYCNDRAGTLVIDNATTLIEIIREVKLEEGRRERFRKQNKVQDIDGLRDDRRDYGAVNAYYDRMMRWAYQYPKVNLILTHAAKSVWTPKGEETEQLKFDGYRHTAGVVQAMLRSYREGDRFQMLIESSRHAPDQCGFSYDNNFELIRTVLLGEGHEAETRARSPG